MTDGQKDPERKSSTELSDLFDGMRVVAKGIREMFTSSTLCAGVGAVSMGIAWAVTSALSLNTPSSYLISVGTGFIGAVGGSYLDERRRRLSLPPPRRRRKNLPKLENSSIPLLESGPSTCPNCEKLNISLKGVCADCGFIGIELIAEIDFGFVVSISRKAIRRRMLGPLHAFLIEEGSKYSVIVIFESEDRHYIGIREQLSFPDADSLFHGLTTPTHKQALLMMSNSKAFTNNDLRVAQSKTNSDEESIAKD